MVIDASVTAPTPRRFTADPDASTRLSRPSTPLSTAVIVTVPVLIVRPAGTISTDPVCVKSAPAAYIPAAADTVSVVGALDGCESLALTTADPPFSEILAGDGTSVAVGGSSSSRKVSVTAGGARTSPLAAARTVTRLSGASTGLFTAEIVTVPVLAVSPAAKVSAVSADRATSADATPGDDTVSVNAETAPLSRVAVTVATPPISQIDDGDRASAAFGSGVMGTHSA